MLSVLAAASACPLRLWTRHLLVVDNNRMSQVAALPLMGGQRPRALGVGGCVVRGAHSHVFVKGLGVGFLYLTTDSLFGCQHICGR